MLAENTELMGMIVVGFDGQCQWFVSTLTLCTKSQTHEDVRRIFMFAPCINDIYKHFIIQLMHKYIIRSYN